MSNETECEIIDRDVFYQLLFMSFVPPINIVLFIIGVWWAHEYVIQDLYDAQKYVRNKIKEML